MEINMTFLHLFFLSALFFICHCANADTHFEIQLSAQKLNLSIDEKRGPAFADTSNHAGIALAAYRQAGRYSKFGAVIEYSHPLGRDAELGSGKMAGFRPLNFLYTFNEKWDAELYLGAAQYEWEKTARGYYIGGNWRYKMSVFTLAADYRYYQDLAYDSPDGDIIVDGSGLSMKIIFDF